MNGSFQVRTSSQGPLSDVGLRIRSERAVTLLRTLKSCYWQAFQFTSICDARMDTAMPNVQPQYPIEIDGIAFVSVFDDRIKALRVISRSI